MSRMIDLDAIDLTRVPPEKIARLVDIARELDRRDERRQFYHWFPDETHEWRGRTFYARDLYPQHLDWFAATKTYREACFMAANRVGKTVSGAYAGTCWLTGDYPSWWPGKVFPGPVRGWASGDTNITVRDIIQTTLLGDIAYEGGRKTVSGTGMIPGDLIGTVTWKQGVADAVDTVRVRHVSGKWSILGFKSYESGRKAFQGTAQHFIWPDEEPKRDIYSEMLTRTATTQGLVIPTFTPLEGMSEVAMSFLPKEAGDEEGEE